MMSFYSTRRRPWLALRQAVALGLLLMALCTWTTGARADGIVRLTPIREDSPAAASYRANDGFNQNDNLGGSTEEQPARGDGMTLRGRVTTIPKGTVMLVKIDQPVSSSANRVGDAVTGILENDVFVNDTVVVPAGAEVQGQVVTANPSGRLGHHGSIDIRFFSLKTPDGVMLPLRAHLVTRDDTGILRGDTYAMDIAKGVGVAVGATGVGAVLGTAAGGLLGVAGTGAAFGTGVGGIAGISYALLRKGKEVTLPSGTRFSIVSDQPTSINPF